MFKFYSLMKLKMKIIHSNRRNNLVIVSIKIKMIGEYIVDLKKWIQVSKKESWKQRPVLRAERGKILLQRVRKERFKPPTV